MFDASARSCLATILHSRGQAGLTGGGLQVGACRRRLPSHPTRGSEPPHPEGWGHAATLRHQICATALYVVSSPAAVRCPPSAAAFYYRRALRAARPSTCTALELVYAPSTATPPSGALLVYDQCPQFSSFGTACHRRVVRQRLRRSQLIARAQRQRLLALSVAGLRVSLLGPLQRHRLQLILPRRAHFRCVSRAQTLRG